MDGKKIKNIVILILLIADVFLAALVVSDRITDAAAARAMKNGIYEAAELNGVKLSADAGLESPPFPKYTMYRDLNAEKKMADGLLGKCSVSDLGGNIMFYSSDAGRATFRGTGEFDIAFDPGKYPAEGGAELTAVSFLGKMGLKTRETRAANNSDGQTETVTALIDFNETPVFNAYVTFTFSDDSLILVSGKRPPDKPGPAEEYSFDAATVLMRFIELIGSEGYVCSEINLLTGGFVLSDTAPGGVVLIPVWRIDADAGVYYINGLTGKPETVHPAPDA